MSLPIRFGWFSLAAILFLSGIACNAQSTDSFLFNRQSISLNATPLLNREVQLFYERALGAASGLEVMVGTRVPLSTNEFNQSVGMFTPSYESRVQALPYENSLMGGVNWKKYFAPGKYRRSALLFSPGVMYRYNSFDNKCYSASHSTSSEDFAQEFSLRKQEVSARVLFGFRRRFSPADKNGALTLEVTSGIGYGMRFGQFDIARSRGGDCASLGSVGTAESRTEHFNVRFLALPVNVKVGYSWGR